MPPEEMEHHSVTTEDNADQRVLLHTLQTLKMPSNTMDEMDWLTFRQEWSIEAFEHRCSARNSTSMPALLDDLGTIHNGLLLHRVHITVLHRFSGRRDASGVRPVLGSLTHLHVQHYAHTDLIPLSHILYELPRILTLTHFSLTWA